MRLKLEAQLKGAMCLHCQLNLTTSKTGFISSNRGPFYAVLVHRHSYIKNKRRFKSSFPSILWPLPKIFFSGFPTDNYSKLRNKRIIPVTNIADLVEYVLLPRNNDVTKPRALNTFLDELAELVFDKGLIKNKNLLSDLIQKEKGYRKVENTPDNESHNEESSSDIENQKEHVKEEKEEEVASENGSEAEATQESENDNENDIQKTERSSLEKSTTFHSENPCEHCENSNVYGTLIMKCPKCFWHDYYKSSPICDPHDTRGAKLHQRGRGILISIPFKSLCILVF